MFRSVAIVAYPTTPTPPLNNTIERLLAAHTQRAAALPRGRAPLHLPSHPKGPFLIFLVSNNTIRHTRATWPRAHTAGGTHTHVQKKHCAAACCCLVRAAAAHFRGDGCGGSKMGVAKGGCAEGSALQEGRGERQEGREADTARPAPETDVRGGARAPGGGSAG